MSFTIDYSELWTCGTNTQKNGRESIDHLDDRNDTHIHGDLSITIDGQSLPHMGWKNEVCFGYWIEGFARLIKSFKAGHMSDRIYGMDQGMPDFLFEKDGRTVYLSIVQSEQGGKADPKWQKVKIDYIELKQEFMNFKDRLLADIGAKAPNVLEKWEIKFL
jgi:hypothetical protein